MNNPSGPQGAGNAPPPGAGAPVGENLGNPPDGEGGGGGAGGGAGAPVGGAPGAFAPPGFASLIKDGKTITINGTIVGADKAQVDFTLSRKEHGQHMPFVVEIIQVTNGKFQVTAPAEYAEPFYVSAVVDAKGDGPTPDDKGGLLAEPLTLNQEDLNIEITITDSSSWQKKLPWFRGEALPPSGAQPMAPAQNPNEKPPLPEGAAAPEGGPAAGTPPGGPEVVPISDEEKARREAEKQASGEKG
jgi:hypothetical protein